MRGATGSPVPRKDPMANLFANEATILTLINVKALKPGDGFGVYVLGDAFTDASLKEMREYEAAYEAWKSDCAARRKLTAERKAAKELEQKEATA